MHTIRERYRAVAKVYEWAVSGLLGFVLASAGIVAAGEPPEADPTRRRVRERRADSRAGRPTTGSGRGATRSWSASAAGYYKDRGPFHHIDKEKPEEFLLARSRDGGATWSVEQPRPPGALAGTPGMRHGIMPPGVSPEQPTDLHDPIDFAHPDFAMTIRMENTNAGTSRFYFSYDRGHTWQGPYRLPLFGQKGVMGRTDMIVNGPSDCIALPDRLEGQRPGRPAVLRPDDRRRAHLALPLVHRARADRLRHHALDGAALGRPTS